MDKIIMIGCDLHDKTTVLKVADGTGPSLRQGFLTVRRAEMIAWIRDFASQRRATRIVFAYEASGQGFGLHDDLTAAGIECHVLAPTHLPHSVHSRKNKTDDNDAEMILDEVRAHVLAGRPIPPDWVPEPEQPAKREPYQLKLLPGVGTLTAMVFLTELGDMARFANRRQLGAYLGLVPSAFESGARNDRKGHITKQGSSRVRHVLCQAAWAMLRVSPEWRAKYDRIKRGSKGRGQVAIVALMGQLGVMMWQVARSPQLTELLEEPVVESPTSAPAPRKRGRPSRLAVATAQTG